jgi:hypothetical protein
MRSRTLGPSKVKELAPKLGVNEEVLAIHNDQYLPTDFDIVITSIGNAFYETDPKTGLFEWKPTKQGSEFLGKLGALPKDNLRDFAFNTLFVAKTEDLTIGNNRILCTRAQCKNKQNCGFVPNYPIINFDSKTNKPTNYWVSIKDSEKIFKHFV